jgi:hypothetical protein
LILLAASVLLDKWTHLHFHPIVDYRNDWIIGGKTFAVRVGIEQARQSLKLLSFKCSLRGADLWHFSAAKTPQGDLPEIVLLTFDACLKKTAVGEGLFDS